MPRIRKIRRRRLSSAARQMEAGLDALLPSRLARESGPGNKIRVVLIGSQVFNLQLAKSLSGEDGLEAVGTASTVKQALSVITESRADLAVVEVDFEGVGQGIVVARDLHERNPSCAFMLVCGSFTISVVKYLWVYGTDSWSVISQATTENPSHVAEAISSAVHGIAWVEPGIERELRQFGPRPKSLDERKLAMFYNSPESAA